MIKIESPRKDIKKSQKSIEDIKKNQIEVLELRNITNTPAPKIQKTNLMGGVKNRMGNTYEEIYEYEDRKIEII